MFARSAIAVVALVFAAIGAHSLSPRELYHEMYPLEPVKRDAFHICGQADPTFVRAVGVDREACYDSMPHIMALAMGRVKPGGALGLQALTDPSREVELLMTLAAMPPREPVIAPRSFADTAWLRALAAPCAGRIVPAVVYSAAGGLPPPAGSGRAAALTSVVRDVLPPLMPRPIPTVTARRDPLPTTSLPVISLTGGDTGLAPASPEAAGGGRGAMFGPLPAPDIGDVAPPAIVPLAPASTCGGA